MSNATGTAYRLAGLYDADKRATDPTVMRLAGELMIPHPLKNVAYADGLIACTHAKKHTRFEVCRGDGVVLPRIPGLAFAEDLAPSSPTSSS